jgi:arylsulfatase A-like enzyme
MNPSRLAATLVYLIALASFPLSASGADRPLNIVFIMADDLGYHDLGCYGSTFYETPRLDELAKSGMRFTAAYAACPVCSPTRSSFQCGKYPARTHNTDFFGGPQPDEALTMPRYVNKNRKLLPPAYLERMPLEEITIAEALKQHGYATFFAGKWHLGPQKGFWPEDQGYEENQGGNQSGHPKSYHSPYENPQLKDGPPLEHLDIRLAKETARFINDHREQPFFVCFCPYEVHLPLQTSDELEQKYEAKARKLEAAGPRFGNEGKSPVRLVQDHPIYAGMVETMDVAVGEVLDALEAAGVADHTAVFFTSDNGGLSTAEGSPTSNVPLRAGKGWMYEGGIRVPLIARVPGVTDQAPNRTGEDRFEEVRPGGSGAAGESYLSSVDYYPTILELAGVAGPDDQLLDGKSFVPLLKGDCDFTRGPVYWHYPHYGNQGGVPARAVRDGDWKLIEFMEDGILELYNLADDPREQRNLAKAEPERTARLKGMLDRWCESVGAQMPSPNPKYKPHKNNRKSAS